MESGSTACTTTTAHDSASGCGWSLKKSKRDAAQQRRVQAAQSLKLRSRLEVQDIQQRRQDPIARGDHQQHHLQRLKLQRSEEADSLPSPARRQQQQQQQELPADIDNGLPNSPWDFCEPLNHKDRRDHNSQQACHGIIWSSGGKSATATRKQHQKQSMRAAVESRRRLARGPRSGSTVADAQTGGGQSMLPSEDHRVVSTVYQAADTQALMRVTLLAAGFVIGARGISARLIGQVTGAIVQSWTESCRPDSVPIRLFRIQGKKAVVQAAVALIEQAVAKYKDLCECKRRGEFVQREHVINGVEFYYQPPPRKAFANGGSEQSRKAEDGPGAQQNGPGATAVPIAPHHIWLQHLQQQQAVAAAQQQKQQTQISLLEASQGQVVKGDNTSDCHGQDHSDIVHQSHAFFDWQPQAERQLMGLQSLDLEPPQECASEFELLDHGLQQSVASLEQALQQVRLEQHLLQRNRSMSSNNSTVTGNNNDNGSFLHQHGQALVNSRHNQENNNSLWSDTSPGSRGSRQAGAAAAAASAFQLGPSLFFFGEGGLPLPISLPDDRSDTDSNCIFVDAAPCTPFDFPHCDFLRESLPSFAWAAAAREMPEYSLYEASPLQEDVGDSFCIVCLEQPACVHLVPCGHNLFCFSCVGGLLTCPLCRQLIVALHPRGKSPVTPEIVDLPSNLNASSYNMWSSIPGASV